MVLKIAEMESRLFITAEKAPFLICIEVFQPQELQISVQQMHAKSRPRAFELLNKFNMINKDSSKLVSNINQKLNKAQYVRTPETEIRQGLSKSI